MIVTVDEVMENSRIDDDGEKTKIGKLIPVAEGAIERMLRRTWDDVFTEYGEWPAPIKSAILMLVDHLYTHPGMTDSAQFTMNPAFTLMLKKYIKLA